MSGSSSVVLSRLSKRLESALDFLELMLQKLFEIVDVDLLRSMDINKLIKGLLSAAFEPMDIRLLDSWVGKELVLKEYTEEELSREVVKIRTIEDVSPDTVLHLELDIEFEKKHVEIVLGLYVNESGDIMQVGVPWVRECPYGWKDKIEDILRKYGPKILINILKKVLDKIMEKS